MSFTTHTPVEAGHDRFSPDLMNYAMQRYLGQLPVSSPNPGAGPGASRKRAGTFCMTVLALKLSAPPMAFSELHGQVSREMWVSLYPARPWKMFPLATSRTASICSAG